jgi:hypothetical protein
MAKAKMNANIEQGSMKTNQSLSQTDIWQACNEVVQLAGCIDDVAARLIANNAGAVSDLVMIRNAVNRIGMLADHVTGYDLCGQNHWLKLPGTEENEH